MKLFSLLLILITSFLSAKTFDVAISNFKFTPNNLEINVGDTVRWTNTQGFHDVTEDNNAFSSGAASSSPFVFEHTFNSVQEVLYYCTIHSTPGRDINLNMNGRINVTQAAAAPFIINQGISGAWFFPDTAGSGILIDIRPSDQFFFAAWFTYDVASTQPKIGSPDNRWFTIQGNYVDGSATNLPIFQSSGGILDNPQTTTATQVGTMSFDFNGCNGGNVSYTFDAEQITGNFPIQRAIPGTELLCESLIPPAVK